MRGQSLLQLSSTSERIRPPLSHFLDEGFTLQESNYLLPIQPFNPLRVLWKAASLWTSIIIAIPESLPIILFPSTVVFSLPIA